MKLYDYLPSGNGYKARLLLSYLDIKYDFVPVNIIKGESQTEAFKSKNPAGQIPLLELGDGRTLSQSDAILYFLAEGTPYLPALTFDRATALQWMFFEQYTHEPSIAVARYIRHYAMATRESELPVLMTKGYRALDVMEQHLTGNRWFAGGGRSVADIALYGYTHVAHEGGFDLADYPAVSDWLARFADHPKHILITDT